MRIRRLQDGAPAFREVRGAGACGLLLSIDDAGSLGGDVVEGVGYMDFEGRVGALPSVEQ
jgi:hypothetical protein